MPERNRWLLKKIATGACYLQPFEIEKAVKYILPTQAKLAKNIILSIVAKTKVMDPLKVAKRKTLILILDEVSHRIHFIFPAYFRFCLNMLFPKLVPGSHIIRIVEPTETSASHEISLAPHHVRSLQAAQRIYQGRFQDCAKIGKFRHFHCQSVLGSDENGSQDKVFPQLLAAQMGWPVRHKTRLGFLQKGSHSIQYSHVSRRIIFPTNTKYRSLIDKIFLSGTTVTAAEYNF